MTNKLVIIINKLKLPKIKKILLYEIKFLVLPNYSCLQDPWLGGYGTQIPVLSVLNWICWNHPHPQQKSWVRHWWRVTSFGTTGSLLVMLFGPQNTWVQPKLTTAINCNSTQHVCLNPNVIITRRCSKRLLFSDDFEIRASKQDCITETPSPA